MSKTKGTDPPKKTPNLATCSYRHYQPQQGLGVRTSLGTPRWIRRDTPWPTLWEVTPRRTYLNAPDDVYVAHYLAQLNGYGPDRISDRMAEIAASAGADTLVLLCFEVLDDPTKWCHRTLFAAWWQEVMGEEVPEVGPTAPGLPFG